MNQFLQRLYHALSGWLQFFRTEKNGQIQMLLAVVAAVAGLRLGLSPIEWVAVWLCIGGVLALEMLNSAIEKLCDLVQPERDSRVKFIKDVAAGAVLWMAAVSVVVAAFVFLPKLWHLFRHLV